MSLKILFSYFYGGKYEKKPFDKECGLCWGIKSAALVTGTLALSTGMTQLLVNVYDEIYSRKIMSGEKMIEGRYWTFWRKVRRLKIFVLWLADPLKP